MELTVLQWNVQIDESIEKVADELRRTDFLADIICVQELTDGYLEGNDLEEKPTWEYLAERLGYSFRVQEIENSRDDGELWVQANAIYSRYPIIGSKIVTLYEPDKIKDPKDQARGYLEVTVDVEGQEVSVGTTQLNWKLDLHSHLEMARLTSQIALHNGLYILTGDFNVGPKHARISELEKMLHHSGPSYMENTWPIRPSEFEPEPLSRRYDYAFHSLDLTVVDARILQTDVSDHLPIRLTYLLPS